MKRPYAFPCPGTTDHDHEASGHAVSSHEARAHETRTHDTSAHETCAHAARRAADAPVALSAAEDCCRERGVRLTAMRRDVLSALFDTHRPLGAYDLADSLAARSHRRVAPITIYRALEFLLEQGFIHRLATKNAFVACPHRHAPDDLVAFLICETCGGVDEAASPDVGAALGRVLAKAGFAPHARVIEIAGICAHCRPGSAKPRAQPASTAQPTVPEAGKKQLWRGRRGGPGQAGLKRSD